MKGLFNKIKKFIYREDWAWAITSINKKDLSLEKISQLSFTWSSNQRACFEADPFLFEHKGKTFVFYEKLNECGLGEIWVSEIVLLQSGRIEIKKGELAIKEDFHVSYPFIFKKEGEIYLMPESANFSQLRLYRAVKFPLNWELEQILIKDELVDATLIDRLEGSYLLTAKLGFRERDKRELYLFYREKTKEKWKVKNYNPVKNTYRSARPAGKLFDLGGQLIRPAQNSTQTYGGSIVFNQVENLSFKEGLKEKEIFELKPFDNYFCDGIHTFNFSDNFLVIDGKRFSFFKRLVYPLVKWLKKFKKK